MSYRLKYHQLGLHIHVHSLKRLEDERIQVYLINRGIAYVENRVFDAAKRGLVKITITEYPFEGCEALSQPSDLAPNGLDKGICENIINGIKTLISARFPDCELIYDDHTKLYILFWD